MATATQTPDAPRTPEELRASEPAQLAASMAAGRIEEPPVNRGDKIVLQFGLCCFLLIWLAGLYNVLTWWWGH